MTQESPEFILLGCGNAAGTPAIGNQWGACDPNEPRNRRTRAAGFIKTPEAGILVDFGPDITHQLNREEITQIDSVLLSHNHGDHVNGIDDLRTICFMNQKPVPIYGREKALLDLETRYPYAIGRPEHELYKPFIKTMSITSGAHTICGVPVTIFEQDHGSCISLGFRFGNMAYSTDVKNLDDTALQALEGVDTWIVDGCAYKKSHNPVHANLETVIRWNERVGASNVYITHMSPGMDYRTVLNELPNGYEPAYDGLRIPIKNDECNDY